jgi:hypothetical protein
MVAVKMRDQDEVYVLACDAEPLQGRQRGGAAIDQEIDVAAGDMKTGVVSATGTERSPQPTNRNCIGPVPLRE